MRYLLLICTTLVVSGPAYAWNKGGHMVSASIAHGVLKREHPTAIPKIIAILKQHPQFESSWAHKLSEMKQLNDEEKDVYLFMLAARWPDDIRSDEEHHHGEWHYINLPYLPGGKRDGVNPPPPKEDNIIRAFEVNKSRAKTGTSAEKAIALCWLFHLIGDGHQPLHTSSLYSKAYPKGDKGGNAYYIRVHDDDAPINLHQFWDDLVVGSDRYQTVHNRAIEFRLRPEFAKDKLKELRVTNFENWIKDESFKLVDEAVYRHGKVAGATEREFAPTLPADYIKATKPIAERRIVLAGYRIADVVNKIVE